MINVRFRFFVLSAGGLVFVFYQFVAPPLFFNTVERAKVGNSRYAGDDARLEQQHQTLFDEKRLKVERLVGAMRARDRQSIANTTVALRDVQRREAATRAAAADLIRKNDPKADGSDTNYIFLTFVIHFLPAGLVGLVLAAIFCAAMSATSSGLNSLASTSVVDILRRFVWRDAS